MSVVTLLTLLLSHWRCVVCCRLQAKSLAAAVEEQRRIMKDHGPELNMDILGEMEVLHLNIQGEGVCVVFLGGGDGVRIKHDKLITSLLPM